MLKTSDPAKQIVKKPLIDVKRNILETLNKKSFADEIGMEYQKMGLIIMIY